MTQSANQSVERMAAGGRRSQVRASWADAIADFFVTTKHTHESLRGYISQLVWQDRR